MKILISILINAVILYAITHLLGPNPDKSISAGVVLACGGCDYLSIAANEKLYYRLNYPWSHKCNYQTRIKNPFLPLFFLFFGLASLRN